MPSIRTVAARALPGRRSGSGGPGPEPKAMTWLKAVPVLVVCLLFDAIRFMFQQFWFFGPALAGVAAGTLASEYVGGWLGGLVGAGVVWGAGPTLGLVFGAFGVILALATGLLGWLVVGLWLKVNNPAIYKVHPSQILWTLGGFLLSEVPFLGSLPFMTITVGRMFHRQIKTERAAHRKWKAANDNAQQSRRAETTAYVVAQRRAQVAAANDNAAQEQALVAANDNAIPEGVRRAA